MCSWRGMWLERNNDREKRNNKTEQNTKSGEGNKLHMGLLFNERILCMLIIVLVGLHQVNVQWELKRNKQTLS